MGMPGLRGSNAERPWRETCGTDRNPSVGNRLRSTGKMGWRGGWGLVPHLRPEHATAALVMPRQRRRQGTPVNPLGGTGPGARRRQYPTGRRWGADPGEMGVGTPSPLWGREAGAWGACGLPEPYSGGSQPPRQRQGQPAASAADRRVGRSLGSGPSRAREAVAALSSLSPAARASISRTRGSRQGITPAPALVRARLVRMPARCSRLRCGLGRAALDPHGSPGSGTDPQHSAVRTLASQQRVQYPAGRLPRSRLSGHRPAHRLLRCSRFRAETYSHQNPGRGQRACASGEGPRHSHTRRATPPPSVIPAQAGIQGARAGHAAGQGREGRVCPLAPSWRKPARA